MDTMESCGAGRGVSQERGWGQGPWGVSFEDEVEV